MIVCLFAARTTTGCVSGWSAPRNDVSMAGGVYQRSVTIAACQEACIATPGCVAIDIFKPPGSPVIYCYLLSSRTALSQAPYFVHYDLELNPNCISPSTRQNVLQFLHTFTRLTRLENEYFSYAAPICAFDTSHSGNDFNGDTDGNARLGVKFTLHQTNITTYRCFLIYYGLLLGRDTFLS